MGYTITVILQKACLDLIAVDSSSPKETDGECVFFFKAIVNFVKEDKGNYV